MVARAEEEEYKSHMRDQDTESYNISVLLLYRFPRAHEGYTIRQMVAHRSTMQEKMTLMLRRHSSRTCWWPLHPPSIGVTDDTCFRTKSNQCSIICSCAGSGQGGKGQGDAKRPLKGKGVHFTTLWCHWESKSKEEEFQENKWCRCHSQCSIDAR